MSEREKCSKITFPLRDKEDSTGVGYTNSDFYRETAEEYSRTLDDWKVERVDYDESLKELDNGLAIPHNDHYLKPGEWITYNLQAAIIDHILDIECEGGMEAVERRLDQLSDEQGDE